jgi:hypothetical protein
MSIRSEMAHHHRQDPGAGNIGPYLNGRFGFSVSCG